MSTWVLLRGLIRERRHWGEFPALLAETLHTRVVTPDLPGNGSLFRQDSPTHIAGMVEHCRAALAAQDDAPPYHVLALSLGAMAACDWAQRYPQELAGCVLINTSLRPFSPFWHRLRPCNYPALLYRALGGDGEALERLILRLTSRRADARVLHDWLRYRRECPVSKRNALRQLLAAMRYRALRAAPAVPLLMLAGAADALVDPKCSQALAGAWSAPLAVHPDAGHDLPLDDGPWVARMISEWLAARRSESSVNPQCQELHAIHVSASQSDALLQMWTPPPHHPQGARP